MSVCWLPSPLTPPSQELWNIFTFYTLNGNPLDPEHMRATQWVKFCKDCGIVGPHAVTEAPAPITEADLHVSYTVEVTRKNRTGIKRMNYNDFLTAVMKIAVKVRATGVTLSVVVCCCQRVLEVLVRHLSWRDEGASMEDLQGF
jgi:hypothetical protein